MASNIGSYTEVTARIRYKTKSKKVKQSGIAIFSDTFEARCIAQYYAQQLTKKLKQQFLSKNRPWDETFQVPIVYYLPGNTKDNTRYTLQDQARDRQDAVKLLQNKGSMENQFKQENYEFLLLIEPSKLRNFLDENKYNTDEHRDMLLTLLEKKQWHLIEAIIDITDTSWLKDFIKNRSIIYPWRQNLITNAIKTKHFKLATIMIENANSYFIEEADSEGRTLFTLLHKRDISI
jgi:hypothetical protein